MSFSSSATLSGALKALADKPSDFLSKNAIVFAPVSVPPGYKSDDGSSFRSGNAMVELVQSPRVKTTYNLQFVATADLPTHKHAANAFVVAYKNNRGNDDVPFVDIPIKAYDENTFLFTVGLTGCSVIVTCWDNKTYRVFHDRRMDSAVLYDNVQMCVNFNDYRIGHPYLAHTGSAITFMIFQSGAWKMFLQRQLPGLDTSNPTWETYAVKQNPVTAKELKKKFNDRRVIIQNRVRANGGNLLTKEVGHRLIAGAVDGTVEGVEYNDQAITGWKALRKAIQSKIDSYHQDPNKNVRLRDTYDRFAYDNSDSAEVDETWIWLQIKKNRAQLH